ncbi:MAG: glycosyltransferase, partial [Bacteroidota bacterium]
IISKFQDIDLLIQLGKSIHEQNLPFHIIVIGQGNQDYKLKNDIPPVISYLGQKSYAEIPKLISRAHIGLSFRKKGKISEDSFPVKTYEYLGVGIPIIVTPVSEAGEYVSANDLGYQFDPADIKGILNTITQLANDPGLYAGIVENIKKVRNQFSREKMSDILAAELRSMASKP